MSFDIDAALDQLEKSIVNQTFDETQTNNQTADVNISSSTTRKSADDLFLIDLDPLAPSNHQSNENPDDHLQRLKFDIQELYAVDSVNNSNDIVSTTATNLSTEQDEIPTMTLPEAVEQLEIEVRQEILQHTFESSSSDAAPLTDRTTVSNDDEDFVLDQFNSSSTTETSDQEQPATLSLAEEIHLTATKSIDIESDLSQQDHSSNPSIIHSVDSIVNAIDIHDLENVTPVRRDTLTNDIDDTPGAVTFTTCDDDDDENSSDDGVIDAKLDDEKMLTSNQYEDEQVSITKSQSPVGNFENYAQDFDLVKNVLSDILDRPEEINLDDSLADANPVDNNYVENNLEQVEHTNFTINEGEFRYLDEMLSSIDVSDADIQQLTQAEMERVDMMLKQIVSNSSPEMIDSQTESIEAVTSEHFQEAEPPQNVTTTENIETNTDDSSAVAAAASATNMIENSMETTTSIDEELVRVEQEWSRLTEEERRLGSIPPQWVNDDQAPMCMKCNLKFTLTRRRHHCRACGKVFCSTCCSQKVKLIHDDNREDRACNDCIQTITRVEYLWTYMRNNQKPRSSVLRKKQGTSSTVGSSSPRTLSGRSNSENKKSVTFDDGVKPGAESPPSNNVSTSKTRSSSEDFDKKFHFDAEIWTDEKLDEKQKLLENSSEEPVEFRIHKNLFLLGRIFENVEAGLSFGDKKTLIFSTRGLSSVAQDELVFVFVEEKIESKIEFLRELLHHVEKIFRDATKGCFIRHFGLSLNDENAESFLSSKNCIGFIYVSDFSFSNSILPEFPYLFAVLIHRQELPTAQCFPIRLLTRLGFEFQKYPWSLVNVLDRASMFTDNQNTIMTMLCDFRCFTYTIPTIRGLLISIGNQGSVSIRIPKNRHDEIVKSLDQSSPHALSFGVVNAAEKIHSKQLVTIENATDHQYKTEVFTSDRSTNEELLVGGNFLVINASLRSRDSPSTSPLDGNFSSLNNLNAKVNTIEDGIMLQLDSETLKILKSNLREGKDYSILAKARPIFSEDTNSTKKPTSEQLVEFVWIEADNDVNRGVRSSIDHFPMDGIRSSRIHYAGNSSPLFRIRWTDLFFIQSTTNINENSFDPTRFADSLAKSFSKALTPYVDMLIQGNYRKLALRVTVDRENASYMAGSNGEQLSSFFLTQLDDQMIPVVMRASDCFSRESAPLILELVFYVLN